MTRIELKRGYSVEVLEERDNIGSQVNVIGNYSKSNYQATVIVNKNGIAPTIRENHGQVIGIVVEEENMNSKPQVLGGVGEKDSNGNTQWKQQNRIYDDKVAISVTTAFNPYYQSNLRIRKLTPLECWRLMGFDDADFIKASKVNSNTQLYKQAGNSIVVNVLEEILKNLINRKEE